MASNQVERPQFYEGQYLGAADLAAVVEHARLGRARHDLGAHTWGIAAGLQLQEQAVAGGQFDVYVLPGYAWDGFGRPIVVLAPYKIPAELFKAFVFDPAIDNGSPAGRLIEVWLRYEETPTQGPRPGFELCDPEALFARVQETFRVEIGQRGLAEQQDRIAAGGYALHAQEILQQFEPQTPPAVLHDASVAFQQLPAAGERKRWLIPLGVVRWLPNATTGQPGSFVRREPADLAYSRSLRRYIGVVAGAVQAADKNIRLRDRTKPYSTVLSDDLVWAEGHVRVEGDTRLFGGKLEWRTATGQDLGVPLDIRRASDASNNTKLQVAIGAAAAGHNRFAVGPLIAGATPADPKVVDEKFVVLDNGNVGIGTTTPLTTLHLSARGLQIGASSTVAHNFHWTADQNGGPQALRLYNGNYGAGTHLLTILPNGNVGIGIPNPGAPLHVANYMTVGPFAATDGVGGIDVTGPVAELGFVKRTLTTWPNPPAPGDRFVWYNPDGTARLWTNSTDLLTVTTAGNVGIGTTAPAFRLDVVDRIRVRQGGTGSAGIWLFQTGPNSDRAFVGMASDNHVGLWGNTGAQWGLVMNTDNGNVGIGALAPAFRLDVADRIRVRQGGTGSAGIWLFQTGPNSDRAFVGMANDNQVGLWGNTGAQWGLVMNTDNGNVGIGTLAPLDKLHVIGNLRISGNALKPGGGFWTNSSDVRLKQKIEPLPNSLERLLQLRGVSFEWKEPDKMGGLYGPQIGLIAQEVEPVFPEWVETDHDGYRLLTIRGFEALVVEALRQLKAENDELKSHVSRLDAQLQTEGTKRSKGGTTRKASKHPSQAD